MDASPISIKKSFSLFYRRVLEGACSVQEKPAALIAHRETGLAQRKH